MKNHPNTPATSHRFTERPFGGGDDDDDEVDDPDDDDFVLVEFCILLSVECAEREEDLPERDELDLPLSSALSAAFGRFTCLISIFFELPKTVDGVRRCYDCGTVREVVVSLGRM